jgi:hypothetical protein
MAVVLFRFFEESGKSPGGDFPEKGEIHDMSVAKTGIRYCLSDVTNYS